MSLLDDEEILLNNTDKSIKIDLTINWLIKHSGETSIYGYKGNYNNLHYQNYFINKPPNNILQTSLSIGTFTTVDLKWSNGKIILMPKNPKYKFFFRDLGDKAPVFVDMSKLNFFKVNKNGFSI